MHKKIKQALSSRKAQRVGLVLSILLLVGVAFSYNASISKSQTSTQIFGWAWSDTIGWVSLDGLTTGSGSITGWAWSDSIGWIKFGGLSGFPSGGANNNAQINGSSVTGWARACAGTQNGDCGGSSRTDGWDGWISLDGLTFSNNSLTGYAWGDSIVGWVQFSGSTNAPFVFDCGSAAGQASETKPSSNLCSPAAGTAASTVYDYQDNWRWSCSQSGVVFGPAPIKSCSAPKSAAGFCGSAAGVETQSAPTGNLCTQGTASAVFDSGAVFTWNCSGVSCSAPKPAGGGARAGVCGSATSTPTQTAPSSNLCSYGVSTSVTTGATTFNWGCTGTGGAGVTQCSVVKQTVGSCGSANGQTSFVEPTVGLCVPPSFPAVSDNGTSFVWSCAGANNGPTASCAAPKSISGSCGTSNGGSFATAPTGGLCTVTGTPATAIKSTGLWRWSCTGQNNGANASCTAHILQSVTLSATQARVQPGTPASLNWSVLNVTPSTCNIAAAGAGITWSQALTNATNDSGGPLATPAIMARTIFTLSCTGVDGFGLSTTTAVNLIPAVEEI